MEIRDEIMDKIRLFSLTEDDLEKVREYLYEETDTLEKFSRLYEMDEMMDACPPVIHPYDFGKVISMIQNRNEDELLFRTLNVILNLGIEKSGNTLGNLIWFSTNGKIADWDFDKEKLLASLVGMEVKGSYNGCYKFNYSLNPKKFDVTNPANYIGAKKYIENNILAKMILDAFYVLQVNPIETEGEGLSCLRRVVEKEPVDELSKECIDRIVAVAIANANNIFEWKGKSSKDELATMESDEDVKAVAANAQRIKEKEVIAKVCMFTLFAVYPFSKKAKNILKVAFLSNVEAAMNALNHTSINREFDLRAGMVDDIFGVDSMKVFQWGVKWEHGNTNRCQFIRNRHLVEKIFKISNYEQVHNLMFMIKHLDKEFYSTILKNNKDNFRQKILEIASSMHKIMPQVKNYIMGEGELEDLYSLARSKHISYCDMDFMVSGVREYMENCGKDDFYERLIIGESFIDNTRFFMSFFREGKEIHTELIDETFEIFEKNKLNMENRITVYETMEGYEGLMVDRVREKTLELYKTYPEETLEALLNRSAFTKTVALELIKNDYEANRDKVFEMAKDTTKQVQNAVIDFYKEMSQCRADVIELTKEKKASAREIAIYVLNAYGNTEDIEILRELHETEKSSKVKKLIEKLLGAELEKSANFDEMSIEQLVAEYTNDNQNKLLAWAYKEPFSPVHFKNGKLASDEYLKAFLTGFAIMSPAGVCKGSQRLAEELQEQELSLYVNELFDKWINDNAEAKKKWVLYVASIYGGLEIVNKLIHNIEDWPKISRGAIAAEAVMALALNPSPAALLKVDNYARKFKFKQVKTAAGKAMDFAAEQLGVTRDVLEDKIVPNLGFDENMERVFDYGTRKFIVTLDNELNLQVRDAESGKKYKNIPAPGKNDTEEIAKASQKEYKALKRELKAVVVSQKTRLELALSASRMWTVKQWKALFVENPVMHKFAMSLIWGEYQDNQFVRGFRYMEDGTFNTVEEDELDLEEIKGTIGLVHPIELTEEQRQQWAEQLEDYEIEQPFNQLDRAVYYITEEEKEALRLDRFGGKLINDYSLYGKLTKFGWYRGSVQDAGGFYTMYREDVGIGLGVELHFSGTCVGMMNEEITIYDARFYKAGIIQHGSYIYDEVTKDNAILLKDIPARYFSEIVHQLIQATDAGTDIKENWKIEANYEGFYK